MLYEWQHLNNTLCNDAMKILVKNYSFNHPIVVLWTFLLFMFFLLLTVVPKSHLIFVYILFIYLFLHSVIGCWKLFSYGVKWGDVFFS